MAGFYCFLSSGPVARLQANTACCQLLYQTITLLTGAVLTLGPSRWHMYVGRLSKCVYHTAG